MKATLYNVISADGYIMTKDGDESFIPDSLWPTVLAVFEQYPIFLMGRKTYDAFQNYGEALLEPFEKLRLRKIVASRDKSFHPKLGYEVIESPDDFIHQNQGVLVSSGSIFNNYLFQNSLIDTIILHQLSDFLGEGIKPFEDRFLNDFTLVSEKQVDGAKELFYKVSK